MLPARLLPPAVAAIGAVAALAPAAHAQAPQLGSCTSTPTVLVSGVAGVGDVTGDADGNVYASFPSPASVRAYDPSGKQTAAWSTGLVQPVSVQVARAEGDILVLDRAQNAVAAFTPSGQPVARWGEAGSGPGQLAAPASLAVLGQQFVGQQDAYIATNGVIERFSEDGTFIGQVTPRGGVPLEVAAGTDGQGDALVWALVQPAGGGPVSVAMFTEDLHEIGQAPLGTGWSALGMDASGDALVANGATGELLRVNGSGACVLAPAGTFAQPTGIGVDAYGNALVADSGKQTISKVFLASATASVPTASVALPSQLVVPLPVACSATGIDHCQGTATIVPVGGSSARAAAAARPLAKARFSVADGGRATVRLRLRTPARRVQVRLRTHHPVAHPTTTTRRTVTLRRR